MYEPEIDLMRGVITFASFLSLPTFLLVGLLILLGQHNAALFACVFGFSISLIWLTSEFIRHRRTRTTSAGPTQVGWEVD